MPLPGTSGKIPAIRNTVTGQRLYTAKLRDRRMTSYMSPELMKQAVDITAGKALLEASGGITDETLREIAETLAV